jgi:biotin carboxyl carrier protein
MKKFSVKINNNKPFEIEFFNDNSFCYKGKKYEYTNVFLSDNVLNLRIDGDNYVIKAEINGDADIDIENSSFYIDINSETYDVICKSELDMLMEKFSDGKNSKKIRNVIESPMPGTVVKLNVKAGDSVKKGAVILVLEAMKMENELKAPCNCIIKEVLVEEKKSVDKGDVLIKLDILE